MISIVWGVVGGVSLKGEGYARTHGSGYFGDRRIAIVKYSSGE